MPYHSVKDVPSHVPKQHRKQWLEVWNSVYNKTGDEGKAFAEANGVIKKESLAPMKEAGKEFSEANMKKIQNIHDISSGMGGICGASVGMGGIYESARVLETSLPHNTSYDALRGQLRGAISKAHGVEGYSYDGPYVQDVFPEHVVYSHKNETYRRKYSVEHGAAGTEPKVTLGEPKKVHTAYVDSKESVKETMRLLAQVPDDFKDNQEQYTKIQESGGIKTVTVTLSDDEFQALEGVTISFNAKESGTSMKPIDIKVIKAGWGASAYYPKDVLERDGPDAFPAGTHMYWNHATESEEMQRPEGDLSDLAAVFVEGARWNEKGAEGPGLYAKAKVFSDYAQQVQEKGPHIGVSINTFVRGREGEIEGKTGRIAEKLLKTKMTSVDFVTKAGAGGAPIVRAQESNREQLRKDDNMTEAEAKVLQDQVAALTAENIRLKEGQNRVLAVAAVGSVLKEAEIPFSMKVLERACMNPTMTKEGGIDPEWVKSVVADFSEGQDGRITGMGEGVKESTKESQQVIDEKFKKSLASLGVPAAGLDYALKVGRD